MTFEAQAITSNGLAHVSLSYEAERDFSNSQDGQKLLARIAQRIATSSTLDEFVRYRNRIADAFEERARNEFGCHAKLAVCVIQPGRSKDASNAEAQLDELARFEEFSRTMREKFAANTTNGFPDDLETILDQWRRKIMKRAVE